MNTPRFLFAPPSHTAPRPASKAPHSPSPSTFPTQYPGSALSLPRDQSAEIKRENGEEKPHEPPCTLAPPVLSCPPHLLRLHPRFSPLLGLGGSRTGTQNGQIRFKKTQSCCNYLGHLPETQLSYLCLHLSHSLPLGVILILIWLADSRRVMAATVEEKEKGLPTHTQDFCRGSLTRIQPLTLHLPQSLLVFNPLLPPLPPHPRQLQGNSCIEIAPVFLTMNGSNKGAYL